MSKVNWRKYKTQSAKMVFKVVLIKLPKPYWYLSFLVAAMTVWYVAHKQIKVLDIPLPRILHFEDTCQTSNVSNPQSLVLFAPNAHMAKKLMSSLCNNSIVSKQFGDIVAYWQTEERDILQLIGKGVVDLMLVKDNFIQAFGTDTTYGYDMVAAYADYDANLMSIRERPLITKEYLLGKRIGLIDYPTSRSGYIAPMRMLKNLDLSSQQVDITYAKSHRELRHLLVAGKVDLISSYWQEEDEKLLSRNYITPLTERISGSKWYLKMLEQNTDLRCAVQTVLTDLAAETESPRYYHNIKLINPCEGPAS